MLAATLAWCASAQSTPAPRPAPQPGPESSTTLDAPTSSASLPPGQADVPSPPVLPTARIIVANKRLLPFSRIAIGTKVSTLGLGGEIAVPLFRRLNLRGGLDFLNFGAGATLDGARYEGQIHLKGGQVSVDWFPFGTSFHISPGFLVFKSALSAFVYVPGGGSFDLGNNSFTSSPSDPILGNADIVFSRSLMPSLTMGFGNMIARPGTHWSIPFEVGLAYTGHYTAQLNLRGSACISLGCMSTSSPLVQQSVAQEQDDLNEPMKHYQVYPIVTTGFAYRF